MKEQEPKNVYKAMEKRQDAYNLSSKFMKVVFVPFVIVGVLVIIGVSVRTAWVV